MAIETQTPVTYSPLEATPGVTVNPAELMVLVQHTEHDLDNEIQSADPEEREQVGNGQESVRAVLEAMHRQASGIVEEPGNPRMERILAAQS